MALVHFYEKPGCFNNRLQRELLLEQGHVIFRYDILQHPWHQESDKLRSFFGDLPVCEWFNRSAPAIKNGEVIPERLDEHQALALMIANPLLIRRPLIEVAGLRRAGFDADAIEAWLTVELDGKDMESCNKRFPDAACRP